jgi:hypothetical protein
MPLPLHVFEPRYRRMVADALRGERVIGMTLLRPGWENDYLGRPAVYSIGCAGEMRQTEALPDGRYNLMLHGLTRFRIVTEHDGRPYRLASIEALDDPPGEPSTLGQARERLIEALALSAEEPAVVVVQPELPDDLFVNALCQSLPLEPVEQQSLLDCNTLVERCLRLVEILEFKRLERKYGKARSDAIC